MSTSTQVVELFNIFSESWGKEKAQSAIEDIESMIDSKKQELATKGDLREVELRLTKEIESVKLEVESVKLEVEKVRSEIEQAKSSTIKWVVGWVAGLLIAYTGAIFTMFTLMK